MAARTARPAAPPLAEELETGVPGAQGGSNGNGAPRAANGKQPVYGETGQPPFYVADRDLPIGTEMGGEAMPVAAFRTGDRVPAEHVHRFGWAEHVHPPAPAELPVSASEE